MICSCFYVRFFLQIRCDFRALFWPGRASEPVHKNCFPSLTRTVKLIKLTHLLQNFCSYLLPVQVPVHSAYLKGKLPVLTEIGRASCRERGYVWVRGRS